MSAPERLATIQTSLKSVSADRPSGGPPKLIAVSKTFASDAIEPVLAAGHLDFGENRVQEAQTKWPGLKARYPKTRLHLIGPLQTNKVKPALSLFDVFHTIDREKLAKAIAKEWAAKSATDVGGVHVAPPASSQPECFIQVNIGEEPQKAGIPLAELDDLVGFCREDIGLNVVGLMCIPPADEAPAPFFALLAKLAARNQLTRLSMGMSGDYETAVRLGATEIRVGSAIFGMRAVPA